MKQSTSRVCVDQTCKLVQVGWSPLPRRQAVNAVNKCLSVRGRIVRLRHESPLPRERMQYVAYNLSSVRGPTLKLMQSRWSPLPDLNWGHPDVC